MYRAVKLPDGVAGRLYLGSMPGRYEVFEEAWQAIIEHRIARVICLVPAEELQDKSPQYARALKERKTPWTHESFPIEDFEAPVNREAFRELAGKTARRLAEGETILVHCAAGIGRTGTFSVCVLLALGMTLAAARAAVRKVGSAPENAAQDAVIHWAAGKHAPSRLGEG